MIYSQGKEQEVVENYFGTKVGILWDFGCNDGITFSNSYDLIRNRGWSGILLDASEECIARAIKAHDNDPKVQFLSMGLAKEEGEFELFHSGTHLNKGDVSLLSSFRKDEIEKWKPTTQFASKMVKCHTFENFINNITKYPTADFISIDIEGLDYDILSSINLDQTQTKCVCVEWNGKDLAKFVSYCGKFGMKLHWRNGENLIFVR